MGITPTILESLVCPKRIGDVSVRTIDEATSL